MTHMDQTPAGRAFIERNRELMTSGLDDADLLPRMAENLERFIVETQKENTPEGNRLLRTMLAIAEAHGGEE